MKIYIRAISAISPQKSFGSNGLIDPIVDNSSNRLSNIEPDYTQLLDPKALRRMSRIVKMGTSTALACLKDAGNISPDAIVTGTAYGCVEDTSIFLSDLIAREEEALTPTAFIQSTHNTVGAQVALQLKCHQYNNTFVHGGISFESALLDGLLLLHEKEANHVLVGSVDELTDDLFTILSRFGLYKKAPEQNTVAQESKGTVAGEGAAFFLLTNEYSPGAYACLQGAATFYKPENNTTTEEEIFAFLISNLLKPATIDLVIMGRNGDPADDAVYDFVQESVFPDNRVISFKQLCGEYPTASSFALWMAAGIMKTNQVPGDSITTEPTGKKIKRILIYNHYQNIHHSLLLLSAVG